MTGICKWWSQERGFGFITGDDQVDYFAHYKQIVGEGHKNLVEGGRVDFIGMVDPKKYPKGPCAEKIVQM